MVLRKWRNFTRMSRGEEEEGLGEAPEDTNMDAQQKGKDAGAPAPASHRGQQRAGAFAASLTPAIPFV